MSTSTNNSTKTASTVNSQVTDSIKAINGLLKENPDADLSLMAYQVMTQAAGMAMLNVVNQQQQLYTLQNTVTTVAAKAMLESNPEEAVKLMNDAVKNSNVTENIKELKSLMDELTSSYNNLKQKVNTHKANSN